MKQIDTVQAYALQQDDTIMVWDEDKEAYRYETVMFVEDDGIFVLVHTDETDPEEPWSFDAFDEIHLYSY